MRIEYTGKSPGHLIPELCRSMPIPLIIDTLAEPGILRMKQIKFISSFLSILSLWRDRCSHCSSG
jgi:hypothetical protein